MKKIQLTKAIHNAFLLTIIICLFFKQSIKAQFQNNYQVYGITLSGAEFGENNLPGILGKDYTYPTTKDVEYFASKGIDLIQLPFKWERVQKQPGGSLELNELTYITKFIDDCAANHISVNLVL